MEAVGFPAVWEDLVVFQFMRGIGRGSQTASRMVLLVGALHDGKLFGYSRLVLGEGLAHPVASLTPPPVAYISEATRQHFSAQLDLALL